MPIYDRPTQVLMQEFARERLVAGQVFGKELAVGWFRENYPKIKSSTVQMHVEGMCINSSLRRHHPNIREGSGHDLFFRVGRGQYRLWDPKTDPAPRYGEDASATDQPETEELLSEEFDGNPSASAFAYERDLQNYLAKNLHALEPGLRLYEDDGFTGVEFPAGSRRIDLLCVSATQELVVVELKVSRGSDRVVGQISFYMAWVQKNLSPEKPVRGIIVANEITEELRLAVSLIPQVRLFRYELAFKVESIS